MGKYFYRSMKKPGLVLRLFCLQTSYCFYDFDSQSQRIHYSVECAYARIY